MAEDNLPKETKPVVVQPKNRIAAKLGLKPGESLSISNDTMAHMTAAVAKQAQALSGMFDGEVVDLRARVRARGEGWIDDAYSRSHNIRGLAGTFGRVLLGRFASGLCIYIEGLPERAAADASIVTAYAEAMVGALHLSDNSDEIAEKLLAELKAMAEAHWTAVRHAQG